MVAMSGGVDSAAAAYLIKEQGFDCAGVTMKQFSDTGDATQQYSCSTSNDAAEAHAVAEKLGIPHEVLELSVDFNNIVVQKFIDDYLAGLTPNPCIVCNRYIKFDMLLRYAQQKGYNHIATGHYARVELSKDGRYLLKKAADGTKDQSYVLYNLTQSQLAHVKLPLGGLTKTQARAIAAAQNFGNAQKSESQDICFIPDGDYAAFIENKTGQHAETGDFLDIDGNVIGQHHGQLRYTIGQRRGLGISAPQPLYVCKKDIHSNTVTLSTNDKLFAKTLTAGDINWILGDMPTERIAVKAKTRYRQPERPASAWTRDGRLFVEFEEPQRAITPGQAVVLYDGDTVLGGGTILG